MAPAGKASLNTHYTNTHDKFFRTCFGQHHTEYTEALLRFLLPKDVQDVLDFKSLKHIESAFPSIHKKSDMLIQLNFKHENKRPVLVLLEHKHQRDPKKAYRQMADYGVAIKHAGLTRKKQPVVLNCIFYHGKDPWQKEGKQGLCSMMRDVGLENIERISLNFCVLDLARLDESLWPKKGALYSILYALLKVPQMGDRVRAEGRGFFRHFLYHLDREDTINLLPSVVSYIADVSNLNYEEVLDMAKSSEAKNLSFLENWEKIMGNPWKEDGRRQGLEQGRAEVAKNMLKKGLKLSVIAEVTGLSQDEIKRLKKD